MTKINYSSNLKYFGNKTENKIEKHMKYTNSIKVAHKGMKSINTSTTFQ